MIKSCKTFALGALLLATLPASQAFAEDTTYAKLHASEPPIAPGQGRIYFYREEQAFIGAALQPTVMINGESTGGRAKPGDYFYIDRPAGTYEISTTTEMKEVTTVPLEAGKSAYVKLEVRLGLFVGRISPGLVDPTQGAQEIADCDYHAAKPIDAPTAPAAAAPATPPADAPKPDAPASNPH
ncbi:MAG TPA: DUF2846 domain-containing protein [Rhizomicrobium sp.]|nr:DUF2846 domain-containing protein [Rhizomicrobium sp.]